MGGRLRGSNSLLRHLAATFGRSDAFGRTQPRSFHDHRRERPQKA